MRKDHLPVVGTAAGASVESERKRVFCQSGILLAIVVVIVYWNPDWVAGQQGVSEGTRST